jgi:hypothetical protein
MVSRPLRVRAASLAWLFCAFGSLSPAAAQLRPDERTPVLLVSSFLDTPPTALGFQVAESVRARIRGLVPQRELNVVPNETILRVFQTEPPSAWTIADVRELAREVGAGVILELHPSERSARVHLEPLLIRGRNEPEHLGPIDASTVGGAAAVLARRIAADSSLRRSHMPPPARKPANER